MHGEKRTNKKLVYVATIVMLVILLAGSIGLATYALLKTSLTVSGNIKFNGTGDVIVDVSKAQISYNGGAYADLTGANAVSFSAASAEATSAWTLGALSFQDTTDTANPTVAIKFTVTNKATSAVNATLTYALATGADTDLEMAVTAGGTTATTGSTKSIAATNGTCEYIVTFTAAKNKTVDATNFTLALDFVNA